MKNVDDRLGSKKGAEEIKGHPWFEGFDWEKILNKEIIPPFKPKISGKTCVDNFDEEFTTESILLLERERKNSFFIDRSDKFFYSDNENAFDQ